MSPEKKTPKRRKVVALTRKNIEDILVWKMGWEYIDVTAFWAVTRKINSNEHLK